MKAVGGSTPLVGLLAFLSSKSTLEAQPKGIYQHIEGELVLHVSETILVA